MMKLPILTALLCFLPPSLSAPTKRAATATAGVLNAQSYNEISISAGVAGSALDEATAKFPVDTTALASVAASDLDIIKTAAQISESAETAVFDPAVASATGTAVQALQNGLIKNKVLKLYTSVLAIQIEAAQGIANDVSSSSLSEQQTKLNSNVALDQAAVGQASTAVAFDGED